MANLPDVKTRMETLSESMMDQSALNDLQETDSGMVSSKCTKKNFQRLFSRICAKVLEIKSNQSHLYEMIFKAKT